MQDWENLLTTTTKDRYIMDFNSVSVNNCYILRDEIFDTKFFTYINSKAIYSASIFHLGFFKGDISLLSEEKLKEYEKLSINLYRLNSPYLYIPFEVDYHENILYQSYYESDHFPLSVWIEEKSLIPYNIFIRIIEDIIYGLQVLETAGHSHLFLTPEEILIPLQWKPGSHVKLYNVGLNSIVSTVLSEKEIKEYRNIFVNYDNNKIVESELIKNLPEDIFAFAKIINSIIPLCNFETEEDKIFIQNIIDKLIKKPEFYNSISEIITLFESIFTKSDKKSTLPEKPLDYSYTGQASFEIPEFNEWQEEAVLEPFNDEEADITDIEEKSIITEKILQNKRPKILNSVASIFIKLFSKKKKSNSASNTLNEYADKLNETIITDNTVTKDIIVENREDDTQGTIETISKNSIEVDQESLNSKTQKILDEIDNHFKVFTDNNLNNSNNFPEINKTTTNSQELELKKSYNNGDLERNIKTEENNTLNSEIEETINYSDNTIYSEFNKSLLERDYLRTYDIIKFSVSGDSELDNYNIVKDLKKSLDDRLKQLDEHFIIEENGNIMSSLLKLDSLEPMEITAQNKEAIEDLKNKLVQDTIDIPSIGINLKNNQNIFRKIVEFLKSQYRKLTHK